MGVRDTLTVLLLVTALADMATSRNHPVLVQLFVDVVPKFIDADVIVLGVEIGCASHHLYSGSHPTTHHHFVISVEFGDGLLKNWQP